MGWQGSQNQNDTNLLNVKFGDTLYLIWFWPLIWQNSCQNYAYLKTRFFALFGHGEIWEGIKQYVCFCICPSVQLSVQRSHTYFIVGTTRTGLCRVINLNWQIIFSFYSQMHYLSDIDSRITCCLKYCVWIVFCLNFTNLWWMFCPKQKFKVKQVVRSVVQ